MRRAALVLVCACGKLQGFGGDVPPLATITIEVPSTSAQDPHVALVWGMQWLTEALCLEILPGSPIQPESPEASAALVAGCRDPFGFVPLRVETSVAITPGVPTTIDLFTLPGADVMVGDVTSRAAYGSLVVYDDRDHNGTLSIARPNRLGTAGGGPMTDPTPTNLPDLVYSASFVTMTAPDQRVAYREGTFDLAAAFYPRAGCGVPPPAFSVVGAGGFSAAAAIAATLAGGLPQEDPASCSETAPADTVVTITSQPPSQAIAEVACTEANADSSVRYREPDSDAPDLTGRLTACVHLPTFDGTTSDVIELIVTGIVSPPDTGAPVDACVGITHYVLKGCREDPNCGVPDWDHTLAPPTWWPCPPP